jgi:hypothetical protein
MPGIVKCFIETLGFFRDNPNNPPIAFIVQSGFPEAIHSRGVEKYNRKLATRLGATYLGTMIKGGVEGIQVKPPNWTAKLFHRFKALGRGFGRTGRFDPTLIQNLATPERFSIVTRTMYRILKLIGLTNFYWNSQLKQNGVFEIRFATPYATVNKKLLECTIEY